MKVKTSAPGKLMLFGEHAVVYNYPCIVTSVSSRIYVEAEKTPGHFKIDSPQVKNHRFVEETISVFKKIYKIDGEVLIKTYSDFSSQYGLGSSSAVTVALILAISNLYKIKLSKKEIFNLGYDIIHSVQGVGSGFDIAAATYGGTIYFFTGGKIIEPLLIETMPLIIGYSGTKADTSTIVKKLKSDFKIFDNIKKIVEKAKNSLIKSDWKKSGELMNQNHELLQKLGVSTEKLDKMCKEAISAGAYGAKLSGAGGGDCIIALAPQEKINKIKEAIIKVGGQIIDVKDNVQGVRIE